MSEVPKMTKAIIALPQEAKQNPIAFLEELSVSATEIADTDIIKRRLMLIAAAQTWAKQYGKQAEPVLRHALASRLIHERRLGELLNGTTEKGRPAKNVIPDDILPDGISRNLSMYAQTLAKVPRGWFDEVVRGILDGARRLAIKEVYLQARRMAVKPDNRVALPENLIVGDFREVGSRITKESVSLIFTDPPYGQRNLPIYEALAEFGSRVLLPGGSLLVYAPHYALPQVLSSMDGKLRYFWTIAVIHKGGGKSLMREYGIRVWFKPILWYVKGDRYNKQRIIRDVIESGQEKDAHEWQQSVVEARYVIEHLTEPGDLVIDPLAGSGTTLIAADDCNRRWLGIEQDPKTAQLAAERLNSKVKP